MVKYLDLFIQWKRRGRPEKITVFSSKGLKVNDIFCEIM